MGVAKLIAIAIRHRSRGNMLELPAADVTVNNGIGDDLRGPPGRRQVTILSLEDWLVVRKDLSLPKLSWTSRRANLLIAGINLLSLIQYLENKPVIRIGSVELEITGETTPCKRMEEVCLGLQAELARFGRGGVTCRVLNGGRITVGDEVQSGCQ